MTEKKTAEEFEAEQRAIPDDRLAEMAQNALSKLCETGDRSITMTVPPRIDDTDMVIAEVIRRFKAYAAQQNPDLGGNVKKFAAQQKSEIPMPTDSFRVVLNEVQELIDYPNGVPQSYLKLIWNHLSDAITEMEQQSKMPTGTEIQEAANNYNRNAPIVDQSRMGFKAGVEWLRNQIEKR